MKKIDEFEMEISESAYREIEFTVGMMPAETGGIAFGKRDGNFRIEKFVADPRKGTSATYTINANFFNPVIHKIIEEEGLHPVAIIHSHPNGFFEPSREDIEVFKKYIEKWDVDQVLIPIIKSSAYDGEFKFFPFVMFRNDEKDYRLVNLKIIKTEEEMVPIAAMKKSAIQDYSRIKDAIDLNLVKNTKIVVVGAGGSFSLFENLVRTGFGSGEKGLITAIDFDKVEEANIVRQGYFWGDIGKQKVVALQEHLIRINPSVNFEGIASDVTKLSKKEIKRIFKAADILVFVTDSFEAQSAGNQLALHYNKPAIWGGYYKQSRASEIVFQIPSVTPACFRCCVSSRYKAQAKQKIKINSNCNTSFHSAYLDSMLGMMILGILHNDKKGFEFSEWFGQTFEKNLIQTKVNPAYEGIFKAEFSDNPRIFNFTTAFQQIEAENHYKYDPGCPDCFGLGNLSLSSKFIKLLQIPVFKKFVSFTKFPEILSSSDWVKK